MRERGKCQRGGNEGEGEMRERGKCHKLNHLQQMYTNSARLSIEAAARLTHAML